MKISKLNYYNGTGAFPLLKDFYCTIEKEENKRWFKLVRDEIIEEVIRVTPSDMRENRYKEENIEKVFTDGSFEKYKVNAPLAFSFWYVKTEKTLELKQDEEGFYIEE